MIVGEGDHEWRRRSSFARRDECSAALLAFITEIEQRAAADGEAIVPGTPEGDWIAWAKQRAEALDPLRHGIGGLFDALSKVTQWS